MQIGKPLRTIVVEPLETPVQQPPVETGTFPRRKAAASGGTSRSVMIPDYISPVVGYSRLAMGRKQV